MRGCAAPSSCGWSGRSSRSFPPPAVLGCERSGRPTGIAHSGAGGRHAGSTAWVRSSSLIPSGCCSRRCKGMCRSWWVTSRAASSFGSVGKKRVKSAVRPVCDVRVSSPSRGTWRERTRSAPCAAHVKRGDRGEMAPRERNRGDRCRWLLRARRERRACVVRLSLAFRPEEPTAAVRPGVLTSRRGRFPPTRWAGPRCCVPSAVPPSTSRALRPRRRSVPSGRACRDRSR